MAKYSMEDVEILRQKAGLSYEEAVNLLEYHNGSLARAMMDLEKNGRMNGKSKSADGHKGAKGVFHFLYRLRLVVRRKEVTVVNLSALFLLLVVSTAPHICVIGLIAALVLGYRFTIDRDSKAFSDETFDDMVKNAKSNMHQFAHQFSEKANEPSPEPPRSEAAPSGTRPVSVPFSEEGSVDVRDGGDGYHEADVE